MKVSICIPAYQQVNFLRRTIQSILEQDFDNYEIIITDDSPDNSVADLLTEFSFDDKLVYVKNIQPLGSPENWNAAIRLAHGEYIKILHHDDYFTRPDSLRKFIELLDQNPEADFGFSATQVEHIDTGLRRIHSPSQEQLKYLKNDPASLFVGNCIGAPSATICRSSKNIDYEKKMKWLVDIDYYFQILTLNKKFAFCSEALISTPTNAAHQVTEICRNNAQIELHEAILLFSKFNLQQRENLLVKQGWMILFRRFNIRKLSDFEHYGLTAPIVEDKCYFLPLFKWHYTRWHLLLEPKLLILKILYRLYPYVPKYIRQLLKNIHLSKSPSKNI